MAGGDNADAARAGGSVAQGQGGAAAAAGAAPARRRRPGQQEVQEVVDELAQETKRTTLLERVEQQLKGKPRYSRLLFGFAVADDRKVQSQIDEEFKAWRKGQDRGAEDLTGLLVYTQLGAAHFLEGPTELLFGAVKFFESLASDPAAAAGGAAPPLSPTAPTSPAAAGAGAAGAAAAAGAGAAAAAAGADGRAPLLGSLRIFHFTELRGVRTALQWTSVVHGGKPMGGQAATIEESNCGEFCFKVYQKMLFMCLKVREDLIKELGLDEPPSEGDEDEPLPPPPAKEPKVEVAQVQRGYKKVMEMLPAVDEIALLLGKSASDFLFSYPEFDTVFVAPFRMTLHSELLWPMAPPLIY